MILEKDDVILFNGDSITDCGRDRNELHSLAGYNKNIMSVLGALLPDLNLSGYNRGISGNTSANLLERLEGEMREVKPTVLSILIGVNDTWRRYDSQRTTLAADFEKNLRAILDIAAKHVKKTILLEPFLLTSDPAKNCWREDLDPKIHIVRALAMQYKTAFIPLDGLFAEASAIDGAAKYSGDGVHPSEDGHALIAREWIKRTVKA